jgi:large subunit ribosomal protein L6
MGEGLVKYLLFGDIRCAHVGPTVDGQTVKMKGSKGELSFLVPEEVTVAMENGAVQVNPRDESKTARAKWGMSRAQVANLVEGVSKGFEKRLEINGVGYKAAAAGKVLKLSLGYSHDIDYAIPAGVTITTPRPTEVVVAGIDKQVVGQTAAEIREYRGPEPYKGKGVKYSDEFIFRKEGKKK